MFAFRIAGLLIFALISGCTTVAPTYTISIPNIQKIRDGGNSKITVANFDLPPTNQEQINVVGLRGSKMLSPYEGSYAKYLREAIRSEFKEAGRLAENSIIELSGVLIKNDVDSTGFSIGTSNIEAQFKVLRNNEVKFDKKIASIHEWESSFVGAVAIPAAINNYNTSIQKLLNLLYSDSSFQEAIK